MIILDSGLAPHPESRHQEHVATSPNAVYRLDMTEQDVLFDQVLAARLGQLSRLVLYGRSFNDPIRWVDY